MLDMTALELGKKIRSGEISAVEAAEIALGRIASTDGKYSAFITVCAEKALERAKFVQARLGEFASPLAGVPIGIKDNICTKGVRTTCASKMLGDFTPPYDATVCEKLENAGLVTLGKLNMDEFALGSTTETSFFGAVKNPWDVGRVPGGSSGGAAAAVAARECWLALGSDTGGSIRQPASYCGVTGIKPTYGAVSRFGLIAYASSLDQIGPIARSAEDCAAVLDLISGHDGRDSTSLTGAPSGLLGALDGDIRGMRIGLPESCFGDGLDAEVSKAVLSTAEVFKARGAKVEYFPFPLLKYAVPAYYIIACAEASSNLSRFDGVKYGFCAEGYKDLGELYTKTRSEGFGMEAQRRILLGSFVLSSGFYDAYYKKALQVKAAIKGAFDEAFKEFGLILCPVAPTTAPRLGESLDDPLKMYLGDIYTVSANLAGLPALSMPCGFDKSGMPIGAQLIGPALGEGSALRAAHAFQLDTGYHRKAPKGGGLK